MIQINCVIVSLWLKKERVREEQWDYTRKEGEGRGERKRGEKRGKKERGKRENKEELFGQLTRDPYSDTVYSLISG